MWCPIKPTKIPASLMVKFWLMCNLCAASADRFLLVLAGPGKTSQRRSLSTDKPKFIRSGAVLPLCLVSLVILALSFMAVPARPAWANRGLPTDLSYNTETTWLLPGLPDLSAAAGYIPHNFSQGEALFQIGEESIHGFRPGKVYPEMYVRDIAWGMETAQYYYPDEYLREPIEAYLRRQYTANSRSLDGDFGVIAGSGAVAGIITPAGQSNKQTITTDEETSLIHAAYLYYNMTYDTDWLRKEVNGIPIIDRLDRAAEWLYAYRIEQNTQLLWRGHTTDWGDVKFEKGPGYTDYNSTQDHVTASIYDQALAYMALIELAKMNAAVGNTGRADTWQDRAEVLKGQTNSLLWQADNGFYLTHLHLTALEHDFDESRMVSIANALAVYSGLTDLYQSQAIFDSLERARLEAGAKKPGLSIHPFYPNKWPERFFDYPGMGYGNYQNGGVWDWWGGVQIKAEFLQGFAGAGYAHLLQVANDWQRHPGNIIEWQSSVDPRHEGSHYYSAAAGTMGSAIIEGFFGVTLNGQGLTLRPRLGLNDGFIRVYQPATDRYAAYRYDWDQDVIKIDFGTNAEGIVNIKVLKLRSEHVEKVTLNGQPIEFETETVGLDTYTVFTAPSGQHQLEIIKGRPPAAVEFETAAPSASDAALTSEAMTPSAAPNLVSALASNPRPPIVSESQPVSMAIPSFQSVLSAAVGWLRGDVSPSIESNDSAALRRDNAQVTRRTLFRFIGASLVVLICLELIVLVALRRFSKLG